MPMTPKIRQDFIAKFFAHIDDATELDRLMGMSAQDLLDTYEIELNDAKHRWPSLDIDAEWSLMSDWLSDRGVESGSRSF